MKNNFYNTINATGDILAKYQQQAIKQQDAVALYMGIVNTASPSQVWHNLFKCSVPLTSVRRAMTNLTYDGVLVKLGKQREGAYGKPECVWSFRQVKTAV